MKYKYTLSSMEAVYCKDVVFSNNLFFLEKIWNLLTFLYLKVTCHYIFLNFTSIWSNDKYRLGPKYAMENLNFF